MKKSHNLLSTLACSTVVLILTVGTAARADLDGAKLFSDNTCVACHQAAGTGTPGMAPALVGQPVVTGDPDTLIKLALLGPAQVLPADRPKFPAPMPPVPKLSDAKLAALLTYIRTKFGNGASAITEDEVAKVRASVGQ